MTSSVGVDYHKTMLAKQLKKTKSKQKLRKHVNVSGMTGGGKSSMIGSGFD
jgi:predicted GTPase